MLCPSCLSDSQHRENTINFREKGNLSHIYTTELGKTCFAYDAACSNSKDLVQSTISDMILKVRAYETVINSTYDGYQRGLASMIYNIFDKKTGSEVNVNK